MVVKNHKETIRIVISFYVMLYHGASSQGLDWNKRAPTTSDEFVKFVALFSKLVPMAKKKRKSLIVGILDDSERLSAKRLGPKDGVKYWGHTVFKTKIYNKNPQTKKQKKQTNEQFLFLVVLLGFSTLFSLGWVIRNGTSQWGVYGPLALIYLGTNFVSIWKGSNNRFEYVWILMLVLLFSCFMFDYIIL